MQEELSEIMSKEAREMFSQAEGSEKHFNFADLLKSIEDEYQADTEILETLKQIHKEVEDLTKYIMEKIASDKSIYKVNSL